PRSQEEAVQIITRQSQNIKQLEQELIQQHIKIADLNTELKEAKEDLKRDEKIFSEKIKEIKKLHKSLNAAKRENERLKQNLAAETSHSFELERYINKIMERGSIPPDLPPPISPQRAVQDDGDTPLKE